MTDIANNSQRGTQDRIEAKEEKILQFIREAVTTTNKSSQHGSTDDGANMHGLREVSQGQHIEIQMRADQETRKRKEAETMVMTLQQSLVEAQQRAHDAAVRAEQAEQRAHDATLRAKQESQKRAEAEQGRVEAEGRADQLSQQLQLEQQRSRQLAQQESHWIVQRHEIMLTREKLGKGAWGKVKVAMFRGSRVAAKCFHQLIISDYNRHLFVREINMAACLRHPNLVQFIGASLEGDPVILTELMTTSLRAVLERKPIDQAQISGSSSQLPPPDATTPHDPSRHQQC